MRKATVIVDASYCPDTFASGWAAWVRVDAVADAIKMYGTFKTQPRNSGEAEVMAAINGIWIAARAGASFILVQSDCMAVIHLLEETTSSPRMRELWQNSLKDNGLDRLILDGAHVKGHTRNMDARSWVNRWCDAQARIAMLEVRKARANRQKSPHKPGRRTFDPKTTRGNGSRSYPSGAR